MLTPNRARAVLLGLFFVCGAVGGDPPSDAPAYAPPDFSDYAPFRVERVVDANTIEVLLAGTPVAVDLIAVRIPPSDESRATAVAALQRVLGSELVYLLPDPATPEPPGQEIPDRAYVYRSPDGLWVNLELVRQGLCKIDAQPEFQHRDLFEAYQKRARLAGRGVWNPDAGRPAPAPKPAVELQPQNVKKDDGPKSKPDEVTVYVTRSGKKYHLPTCEYCTDTSRPLPLKEAAVKYGPCRVCKPPEPPAGERRP